MGSQSSATGRLSSVVPVLSAVALATALAAGLFMIGMPLAFKVFSPSYLPPPFPSPNQDAETSVYLSMIAIVVPLSSFLVWRLVKRIAAGPSSDCLPALTAGLITLLGFGVLLIRVSDDLPWGDGIKATLGGGLVWTAIALFSLWRAGGSESWSVAGSISKLQKPLFVTAALAVVAGALSFVRLGNIDVAVLFLGLILVALVSWLYYRSTSKHLPRKWGIASDVVMLVLVLLAVPDMVILYPEAGETDFNLAYTTDIIQFHQSLFLGAASQVLHGSALLVDTVSQYGIGSIYLIAAFFKIAPIGSFTLGFFDGALTAVVFGLGYLVLRMSRTNRAVSAVAMVTAVLVLAWGLQYPVGGLLQHGAIRFGLPMLLIAPVVAGARWPRSWPYMKWIALVIIGLSSIWALEAMIYVTFTALALIAMGAVWKGRDERRRWIITALASVVAAWVTTHILFALITLIASGSLPEWGLYLSYLRDFLAGDIGDLTYDVSRWSPSILVFGVYLVSTFSLVALAATNRTFTESRRPAFLALTGLTAYGVVLFSYYDNRSLDHVLPYVCLPALLVVALWVGLIIDRSTGLSTRTRTAALATGLSFAVLAVANVWPAAPQRGEDSLLAYAIPGGNSLSDGFDRIWNPPPIKPGALPGQLLVEQYFAGEDKVPVLTESDLDVEILDRTQRANQLGFTDAKENSWVPGPHEERIAAAVDDLEAGDRLLFDSHALQAFNVYEVHPDLTPEVVAQATGIEPLQAEVARTLSERYRLRVVAEGDAGMYVVELEPEKPAP